MSLLQITVAGKGGTGKTVCSGILARGLARDGRRVLAVDGDDNPMLAISLGVPVERIAQTELIPTDFWVKVERPGRGSTAVLIDDPAVLIQRHGIAAPDGVTLLAAPIVPNGGCTSDAGVRGMLGVMLGRHLFERVVTDFEAGVDAPASALGGFFNPADVLLVVATPNPISHEAARKISQIAREAGVARVYGVANQVRSAGDEDGLRAALDEMGLECAAVVPFDPRIAAADVAGASPLDQIESSPGVAAILDLARRLDAEAAPAAAGAAG